MPRLSRTRLLLAPIVALASPLPAQTFAYNKVEFGNWWLDAREDVFPNYVSASGNRVGDGLFKVFPGEILERGANHRISGYQVVLSVDDAFTGTFPVQVEVPAVQFYRTQLTTLAGVTYEVPDLSQPVGPRYDAIPVSLASDSAWVFEVRFAPTNTNPRTRALLESPPVVGAQRRGLAMVAIGKTGDRRAATVPGVVLQSSFNERHFAPGRASYSGSVDGATGTLRMFGTSGMPSATGELAFALRLQDPTLQLAGPSAGGVANDPQRFETELGVGAYATDLASRLTAGHLRLVVQGEQFDPGTGPPTHLAFPFVVAVGALGPTTTVGLGPAALRFDPASLGIASVLVDAGFLGGLRRIGAASGVGFDLDQRGIWNSAPLPIARNAALVGAQLWIQALITTTSMTVVTSTNAVRLSL